MCQKSVTFYLNRFLAQLRPVVPNTRPAGRIGPSGTANIKKSPEKETKSHLAYFLNLASKFKICVFIFFQCGPQDLTLSLMRPPSHFEFETPGVDPLKNKEIGNLWTPHILGCKTE